MVNLQSNSTKSKQDKKRTIPDDIKEKTFINSVCIEGIKKSINKLKSNTVNIEVNIIII